MISVMMCEYDFTGTALEALASMQSFLRGRPSVFKSLEHAIEWWYVVLHYNYIAAPNLYQTCFCKTPNQMV